MDSIGIKDKSPPICKKCKKPMKDKRRLLMLSADYECTDCGIGWWKGINGHYIEEEPAERSKPCSKCGMHSMSWEQRDG